MDVEDDETALVRTQRPVRSLVNSLLEKVEAIEELVSEEGESQIRRVAGETVAKRDVGQSRLTINRAIGHVMRSLRRTLGAGTLSARTLGAWGCNTGHH